VRFKKLSTKYLLLFIIISLNWVYAGCAWNINWEEVNNIPAKEKVIAPMRLGEFITAGDFNGDGNNDIAVGIPTANSNRGEIYLFYNAYMPGDISIYSAKLTIRGEIENEEIGKFIWAGDLDGDGKDDLIIGSPIAESNKGVVYIFYGENLDVDKRVIFADAVIQGYKSGDQLGKFVKIADLNDDNKKDLIIGVSGIVYIFYGERFRGTIPTSLAAKSHII